MLSSSWGEWTLQTLHLVLGSISLIIYQTILYGSVHDRKVSVLGFCSLLHSSLKPRVFVSLAPKIVPAIITQMEGLVEAYKRMMISTCIKTFLHTSQRISSVHSFHMMYVSVEIAADTEDGKVFVEGSDSNDSDNAELDSEEDDATEETEEYILRKLDKGVRKHFFSN